MSPPEALLTQLDLYAEEKAEDQESLRYQTLGRQSDDSLDYSLGQLAKLAQEHSDNYPVLVDTMKRYVQILERDIDE
jgi:diaphanous 1